MIHFSLFHVLNREIRKKEKKKKKKSCSLRKKNNQNKSEFNRYIRKKK